MDKIYSAIKLNFQQKKSFWLLFGTGFGLMLMSIILLRLYLTYYQARFYQKTFVENINVSGLTLAEAKSKLIKSTENSIDLEKTSLQVFVQEKKVEAKLQDLGVVNDIDSNLTKIFARQHQGSVWQQLKKMLTAQWQAERYYFYLTYEENQIRALLEELKKQVDQPGKKPSALIKNQEILIDEGQVGQELLINESLDAIRTQIFAKKIVELTEKDWQVQARVLQTTSPLSKAEIETSEKLLKKFIKQTLHLTYEYQKIALNDQQLLDLIALPDKLDQEKIETFLEELKTQINRPSRNASFQYDPESLKVTEFVPDQDGLEIDTQAVEKILSEFLEKILELETKEASEQQIVQENTFVIPMKNSPAEITLAETNELGIKEVIGFGESWYDHSIPGRIDNVALTTDRINLHLVKPGEEFSFNQALGEVSDKTGFKNAYIIEKGETKLAPGGGVCQVSSTLFRALLNAGVKITRRLPHAYRVSYYEIGNEPGFDATVYAGNVDLRFINDTPGHILISCQSDSKKLYMFCKLYGASDGRKTEISKYKKWGQVPALPAVYIPDPSLKPGQLKQIDWAASGIKAEFTNVIRDKDGELIREDYYYSNYRPWAAKYLRGI